MNKRIFLYALGLIVVLLVVWWALANTTVESPTSEYATSTYESDEVDDISQQLEEINLESDADAFMEVDAELENL